MTDENRTASEASEVPSAPEAASAPGRPAAPLAPAVPGAPEAAPEREAPPAPPAADVPPAPPVAAPEADPWVPPAALDGSQQVAAAPTGPGGGRHRLRAVLRWTAAIVAFASVGTAVAYGIIRQERTDVPGLSTLSDGRWAYPKLVKPVLPPGAVQPFDEQNPGRVHYADLAALLLPAPAGARADTSLKGSGQRVPVGRFLGEYPEEERADLEQDLADGGLRHVVARGWTMPDSTSTRIYLLRFHSAGYAEQFATEHLGGYAEAELPVNGVEDRAPVDDGYPATAKAPKTDCYVYDESPAAGPAHVRHAYIAAGDTLALIIQERKGRAHAVPFHQTVVLQSQLLG
ncbi:hypothetical protein ABZ532_16485 [Streptomyces sp. NPDC019396]|uniref:hypothetical protein n=1 Tax=Streptomyces sp. NPDC019396 TaxID=3154687 RepID=UPI0033FE252B